MIAMASSVIMLCDSSKFERTSLAQFATLDQIDVQATETSPGGFLDQLIGLGVEVLCGGNG